MYASEIQDFYKGKKVLVTGHTGFKGSWLSLILTKLGANVTGYSLNPPTEPNLFNICKITDKINSKIGDIRDLEFLNSVFDESKPEIVIHLAAQPLVRESYLNPRYTYETNVMGTVNVLECVRKSSDVKSFLNVTTDKVYDNKEWEWGYREIDSLDGFDPYSNSKSCSELVTHCYKKSFFSDASKSAISTARAGNVIGGGDFSVDRIIPDCVRAARNGKTIIVRNPYSIRPYQHVLEPLFAYLMIAKEQYDNRKYEGWYNIGPDYSDCVTTGKLVDIFCQEWGEGLSWNNVSEKNSPHEARLLKLDCSRIKNVFNWKPTWNIKQAVAKTIEWEKAAMKNSNMSEVMEKQIDCFIRDSINK